MERRTTTDDVFERLHADIVTLKLKPGTRLSEVDVARQFEISRQPVREAFIRLHDLELLHVKPQRATEVRRISEQALRAARFVRTAVEVELLRIACDRDTRTFDKAFEKNLEQQRGAIEARRVARFHTLDYAFHHLICKSAEREFAYASIASNKSQLDRLCMLSLTEPSQMQRIHADHVELHRCIAENRAQDAEVLIRRHLSRVIDLLESVRAEHPDYFADV